MNVRKLNDDGLEHLIAYFRYSSLVALALAVLCAFYAALAGTGRLAVAALVAAIYALGAGYLGWWHFGNSTWRKDGNR